MVFVLARPIFLHPLPFACLIPLALVASTQTNRQTRHARTRESHRIARKRAFSFTLSISEIARLVPRTQPKEVNTVRSEGGSLHAGLDGTRRGHRTPHGSCSDCARGRCGTSASRSTRSGMDGSACVCPPRRKGRATPRARACRRNASNECAGCESALEIGMRHPRRYPSDGRVRARECASPPFVDKLGRPFSGLICKPNGKKSKEEEKGCQAAFFTLLHPLSPPLCASWTRGGGAGSTRPQGDIEGFILAHRTPSTLIEQIARSPKHTRT